MACRYTYKGKTYELSAFDDLLRAMPPSEAAAFMPTVQSVPNAPFVTKTDAWVALALKRIVKIAVDEGYDSVAFITGEQSADRYDLSKQVDSIRWSPLIPEAGKGQMVKIDMPDGRAISLQVSKDGKVLATQGGGQFEGKELADVVGKDIAEKIIGKESGFLKGLDLKVGGEGMKAFYDRIVPAVAKDVLRKVGGGAMETVHIGAEGRFTVVARAGRWQVLDDGAPYGRESNTELGARTIADKMNEKIGAKLDQPGFPITDAMREKVAGGVPLFQGKSETNRLGLTAEVRGVFDRILATEEQIAEAEDLARYEAIYKTAEEAGMDPEEWAVYQEMHKEGTDSAIDKMQARSVADMKWAANAQSKALKALQAEVATQRADMKAEVTAEVQALPVEQARAYIRELEKTAAKTSTEHKVLMAAWREQYNAEKARVDESAKAEFPDKRARKIEVDRQMLGWEMRNTPPRPDISGTNMDVVADMFGFSSADHMAQSMATALPADQVIDKMTEERLREKYGEAHSPAALQEAAAEAVHNEARARFIATELATMQAAMKQTERTGNVSVNVLVRTAKDFAKAIIGRTRIMDLKPARFTQAETRAAAAVQKALGAGKQAEAVQAQRDRLFNLYAAREAFSAKKSIEVSIAYLKRIQESKTIDKSYLDQIHQLLERVELREVSNKTIERRESLAEWIKSQEEQGISPDLDEALVASTLLKSYKQMTVEEFSSLTDTIKQIEHIGRLKHRLLKAKDQREFDAIAEEVAASIVEHGGKPTPAPLEPAGRAVTLFHRYLAEHRKLASLIRQMDGGAADGPFYQALARSMNEAGTKEVSMLEAATVALAKILDPVSALPGGLSGDKIFIKEINDSLSRAGRIAVALNTGNEGNLQRLMDGRKWTDAQVRAIVRTLTPLELKAVNEIWAHIDSYMEESFAKQERVTGTRPERVVAVPYLAVASDGTQVQMRGGYYPAKYDPAADLKTERQEALADAKEMLRGAVARPTTRRGHLMERAKQVNRPIRLDLSPLTQHVSQTIHDIAWHEWFIDANRLMNDKRIASAIRDHYGPEVAKTMKDAINAIAVGDAAMQNSVDQLLMMLRSNVSRSVMGWSLTTAFMQPFGLTQSMSRIGVMPVLRGMGRWAGDTAKMESTVSWITEKSDFMRLRAKTMNREIREISSRIHGKSKAVRVFDASLFMLMQKMQLIADVPTWLGAYEAALLEGKDDGTAVELADDAVRSSQGGGLVMDLAAVQRDHPFLTMFYSYFSTTYQLLAEKTAATEFKDPRAVAGWLADVALLAVIPAIGPSLLMFLLKGGGDDDPEKWAKRLAEWQANYLFGLLLGFRDLPAVWSPFDYGGPPVGKIMADLKRVWQQTGQGEIDEALILAYINAIGTGLGLPTVQTTRMYRGWKAWSEGKAPPTSILMGPPPKD